MTNTTMSKDKILSILDAYCTEDLDSHGGNMWAYVRQTSPKSGRY